MSQETINRLRSQIVKLKAQVARQKYLVGVYCLQATEAARRADQNAETIKRLLAERGNKCRN